MSEPLPAKERLSAMTAEQIVNTLSTTDLAVLGALSVMKHIHELRDNWLAHAAHNSWVFKMSDLGILKEFENE